MDAADLCLQDAYTEMLEANKDAEIVAQPEMEVKAINEKCLELEFTLTLKPEVKLGKYTGLDVKKETVKVSKKEVEDTIKQMQERYAENVNKDGKVEKGNIAVIDFEGFRDGVAFAGGKGENYSLEIGSNTFIPGFEDQVIGMKKGEEKEINVTFPKDYPSEDLKGKAVVFKVKVNEIKEKKTRTLDEEFFEDLALDGVKDEESLRKQVEETIKSSKEIEADNKLVDDLLKEVANNTEVDIPDALVEHELHHMVERFGEQLRMQGMDLNYYYEITKSTENDLKNQMREEATNHIKYRFILDEIKKLENITVTDDEVNEEVKKSSASYGMKEEDFLKAIGGMDALRDEVEVKKVLDFLKENNK